VGRLVRAAVAPLPGRVLGRLDLLATFTAQDADQTARAGESARPFRHPELATPSNAVRWTRSDLHVFENTKNKGHTMGPLSLASQSLPRDEWSCQRSTHDPLPLPPL
jgi:hypothetical protein